MRPNPRPKYNARMAKAKIEKLHSTKVRFLTGFKTRIHGTDKQIGQKFPVGSMSGKRLPLMRAPKYHGINPLTPLELDTIHAEERMLQANLKGFTIGIKLKSGEIDEIPLIAKSWHQAFAIAHKQMQKYDPEDIDEITIVDPSLKEIAHAISGGAHRFAGAIKKGIIETIPGYARKVRAFARKAARKLGRVAAIPAELREEYAAAKKARPWLTEEKFAKEKGIPTTEAEWRAEPTPEVYMPERIAPAAVAAPPEEYTPYQRRLLAAETEETMRREAAIAAAPRAARPRINGRSWKPFAVPLLDYQSGMSAEQRAKQAAEQRESEAEPSRIGLARRKAAWKERAPVKIER